MSRHTEYLVEQAMDSLSIGDPIQLDLFACLVEAGVDVEELERTARNGHQLHHVFV